MATTGLVVTKTNSLIEVCGMSWQKSDEAISPFTILHGAFQIYKGSSSVSCKSRPATNRWVV